MNGQIITIVSRLIQAFGAYMVIVGAIRFLRAGRSKP